MGSGEMEVHEEGARNGTDVTIYLVPKHTKEQGYGARKRKHCSQGSVQLDKIYVDSLKLRECSTYFAACMSGRWVTHTPTEFHLEAHTKVRFYKDCFSRMYFPYKPIASVGDCIELLRVASLIGFAQVLDIGVKHLAAVPWSDKEENQIRTVCASGQLCLDSTDDLHMRLQLPCNAEDRQQNYLNLVHRVLSHSLQLSIHVNGTHLESTVESRKMFRNGLQAIVSGSEHGKSGKALQNALTLVCEESKKLFLTIMEKCQETHPHVSIFKEVENFCWLFDKVSHADAAQPVVELILKSADTAPLLLSKLRSISSQRKHKAYEEERWARMMWTIFKDVLDGRLFLTTTERLSRFNQWNYFLKINDKDPDFPLTATLASSFILTFPLEDQEEIYRHWVSSLDDPAQKADQYDLSEAHSLWMTHLVSKAENLRVPDAPKICSSARWEFELADGESSGQDCIDWGSLAPSPDDVWGAPAGLQRADYDRWGAGVEVNVFDGFGNAWD